MAGQAFLLVGALLSNGAAAPMPTTLTGVLPDMLTVSFDAFEVIWLLARQLRDQVSNSQQQS